MLFKQKLSFKAIQANSHFLSDAAAENPVTPPDRVFFREAENETPKITIDPDLAFPCHFALVMYGSGSERAEYQDG